MLGAKYLTDNGWSEWEPCKFEWALKIASIYGNRSADEFLFEDLPRGECEYGTGNIFADFGAIAIRMSECPCEHVVEKKTALAWLVGKIRFFFLTLRYGL